MSTHLSLNSKQFVYFLIVEYKFLAIFTPLPRVGPRKRLFENRGGGVARLLLLRNKWGGGHLIVTKCYIGGEGGKKCLIFALRNI